MKNDGIVLNNSFKLKEDFWIITDCSKPLTQYLNESLDEQRSYIQRLTKRADNLEEWLKSQNKEK